MNSFHPIWTAAILVICLSGIAQTAQADDAQIFEQARRAQLHLDWQNASELYDRVKESPLSEAALCYRAQCLAYQDQPEQAIDLYRAYLSDRNNQLYRGEVLLELARLLCTSVVQDQKLSLAQADGYLGDALDWVKSQSRNVMQITGDDPGNLSPLFVGPKTVLHAGTTPWYLPRLHTKILFLRVYVLTAQGKQNEAMAGLTTIEELNQPQKPSWVSPQVIRQLRADVQRGCFLLPLETWESLSAEHAAVIRLASFYCQADEVALAHPILLKTHALTAQGAGKADDWAACELALANCDYILGHKEATIARLRLFAGVLRASTANATGRFMLANVLAADVRSLPESYQLYTDLASPRTTTQETARMKASALLAMLVAALNQGDSSTAFRAADRLATQFAGSIAEQIASQIIASQSNSRTAKFTRNQDAAIQVIHSQKTLMAPGTNPNHFDFTNTKTTSLMSTAFSYGINSWCEALVPRLPATQPSPPLQAQRFIVVNQNLIVEK